MEEYAKVKEEDVVEGTIELSSIEGDSTEVNDSAKYSRENVPFTVALLPALLAAGADYFGLGCIGPILPYWVFGVGETEEWVGYITTAQFAGVLAGGIVMSRIGDIYGLKVALLMTMVMDVILFLITGYVKDALLLAIVRFGAGFFTPLVLSVSWVINASDARPEATRNTVGVNVSIWAFMMSVFYTAGAAMAGLLGEENWKWIHIITSIAAGLAFCYILTVTEPPRRDSGAKPEGVDIILKQPEYIALVVNNVSIGLVFTGGLVAGTLVLINELNATPQEMSIYFIVTAAIHGIINFALLPAAMKRYGTPFPAMIAVAIIAVLATICLCFEFAYSSIVSLCVFMILTSTVLPIFMTSANIICGEYALRYTKNARTVVLGMARSAFNVGQMLGPILAVALLSWDKIAWFVGIMLITLPTWLLWYYFHHKAIRMREENDNKTIDKTIDIVEN